VTPARALKLGLAAGALVAARVCLRAAPGRAVRWASAGGGEDGFNLATPETTARAVVSVGSKLRASCLEQSLALVMLLTAVGIPARLIIGVRRPGNAFAAHAWVESRGCIILGAEQAVEFVPLPSAAPVPCRG
jgi:Transglutaminase-like superfamily